VATKKYMATTAVIVPQRRDPEKCRNEEENFKVKIPKKFRRRLILRFTPGKNLERISPFLRSIPNTDWEGIEVSCPLCEEYEEDDCANCPFTRFKTFHYSSGCKYWVKNVMGSFYLFMQPDRILWLCKDRDNVLEELHLLGERANKLIEWV